MNQLKYQYLIAFKLNDLGFDLVALVSGAVSNFNIIAKSVKKHGIGNILTGQFNAFRSGENAANGGQFYCDLP